MKTSRVTLESRDINRREFVGMAAGAVALAAVPYSRVLGANNRIRIGLIGAGDRGQQDLKDALAQPDVECVAVADVYSLRRDQAKAIVPAAETYDDPRRLLDRKDIDAVIIATPLHLHAKYFLDSLAAGKDVYCEKTMTWDIPEAVECRTPRRIPSRSCRLDCSTRAPANWPTPASGTGRTAGQGHHGGIVDEPQHAARPWPVVSRDSRRLRSATRELGPVPGQPPEDGVRRQQIHELALFWEFSGGNVTENMVHQIAWIMTAMDLPVPQAADMMGGVYSEKDGRQVPDTIAVTFEFPNDLTVLWQSTFSNSRFGLGERFLGSDGTIEHITGATDMVTGKYQAGINYYPEKTNRADGVAMTGKSQGSEPHGQLDGVHSDRNQKTNAPVEIGYKSAVAAHMANLAYRQNRRITLQEAMAAKPEY